MVVKDAIVDQFVEKHDERPSVDKVQPDIRIQARLLKETCLFFYLDFSGRSLFHRGYREHTGAAPLKENLGCCYSSAFWLVRRY